MTANWLLQHIRDIPDFPEPGVLFKDITPLLGDGSAFGRVIHELAEIAQGQDGRTDRFIDKVVGIEARGFVFGAPVAVAIGAGFVPLRKPGKLPYETVEHTYELEYGTDSLSAHVDAVEAGERVLLVDDVLATGGTASAAVALLEQLGAEIVCAAFVLELGFLAGRARLSGTEVVSLLTVE